MSTELQAQQEPALPEILTRVAVYREERGQLAIAVEQRADTIDLLYPLHRERTGIEIIEKSISVTRFGDEFSLVDQQQYPPSYLALNLLGRYCEGSLAMSARVRERLVSIMQKEDLMKLSERALAKEYSRVMGLAKPIQKIASDPKVRGPKVDEMLAKLATSPAALNPETPGAAPQEAGAAAATGTNPAPASEDDVTKAKAAKKKGSGKKRDVARVIEIKKCERANPYREGSKKHQAFDIYKKGGDRGKIVEQIAKLGVTASTANTWLYFFNAVAETGKQPDWKEKRKAQQ